MSTSSPFRHSPLTLETLQRLSRDLAGVITLKSQVPPQAIAQMAKESSSPRLAAALSDIAAKLQQGKSLGKAIVNHERIFGTLFCHILLRGETSGNLGPDLARLADYYAMDIVFHKKTTLAFKYSAITAACIIGTMATVFTAFVAAILPKAVARAETLPAISRAIITVLSCPRELWPIIAVLLFFPLLLIIILKAFPYRTPVLPFFLPGGRERALRYFSSTLSLLAFSGVEPSAALNIAGAATRNGTIYKRALSLIESRKTANFSLAQILQRSDIIPSLMTDLSTDLARKKGDAELFRKVADFYQEEALTAVTTSSLFLGPTVVAITGLLGLAILAALFGPLFPGAGNP